MAESLRVLMAQINPLVGAIAANSREIVRIIHQEQQQHDLIIFPELALCGYSPDDLLLRDEFFNACELALAQICQQSQACHVIVGHPSKMANRLFNSASVFYQGKQVALYHKQKLPNYGVFDEARYFSPGPEPLPILTIKGYRLSLCICEDLWQEGPVAQAIAAKAEGLICLNASPFDYLKPRLREKLLSTQAKKGLFIFYVNLVGGQDELVFDGQSLVFNKQGQLLLKASPFQEELISLELTHLEQNPQLAPVLSEEALIYQALVLATKDYVGKNNFPGVLVGLSGGIDSALTLAIAVDALGPARVEAVMMPSRFSAAISLEDAELEAKALGISSHLISIEPSFNCLLESLAPSFAGRAIDVTEQNIQARIRGLLLMALSNKSGNLVLTTSNKSETAVGYATLYGDMAGGFAVLKDVLKTQVYALANYRNSLQEIIPSRVLTRAPSAELAFEQKDEDNLPPYPILDALIKGYVEESLSAAELISQGYAKEVVEQVLQLIKRNEYKRRQAAPGPKVSPLAFGRDWRYPITSGF